MEREFSRAEITLRRKGEEALGRLFPAQVRDHSVFHALQAVNADGHTFDVFCQWPDGSIRRPVLVGWQDIYSGKILSYRVDQTEHSGLVRLSFGDLVEKFGIPEQATLDNGRAWASKDISGGTATRFRFKIRQEDPAGLLTQMGVQIHWATTYHGQAKPIERAWRDLCEHVAKHPACEGAYTGNKPTAKPENYGTRAIKLEAFMKVLDTEIAAHNARPDRRSAVCDGRSFDAVFNESYARATIRRASNAQRTLWMLAAEGVSLHQQSGAVSFMGNRYWIPALVQHAGEKSVIRFDPQRLHDGVHVYSLEGRHIGYAKCETAAGFNDLDRAREHARARHEFMRSTKKRAQAEVRMTAAKVAEQLPQVEAAPVPVRSNVVAPVFGKSVPLPESHGYDNFDRAMERLKA